ncbi:amylase [Halomonas sp. ZH2S]|uniref:Amylase n=1 Tax=Vreelandella zhuhanensis TaxID=2684210 RepID=A0A7X3GXW9_9GAMM|nr:PqqD family peptide modification chaperone [Halomonas zhuhanensis]MWJ26936.1 amylase [Halomonas zhuhanensis]
MAEQKMPKRRYWLGGKRAAEQDRFFREALETQGWEPGNADEWDAGWYTGMPDPAQFKHVSAQRKLNHFPGNNALTVKSRLHDILAALRSRIHETFGPNHEASARLAFFPRVYSMPKDYHALQQAALAHPEKHWILKPKNASKGKGIRVLRDVGETPLEPNWMVQEYLAHPHTIRGHKYVLRLYVLIASLEPLRLYVYRQGFAKLASEPYDVNDADNPYSQLTNPDINALNTSAEIPVEFIDLERYREWLRHQGHDDERLFKQIHDLITLTVISALDAMRQRTAEFGADSQGCYELLGLDCMVDADLKPWILECNLSPSLGICAKPEDGGIVEEKIKNGLVKDMVALVGIDAPGQQTAETFAQQAEQELARAGGFQRLYPNRSPSHYLPYFSLPRLADIQLADALAGHPVPRPTLCRWQAAEVFDDDQLALYATHTGHYYRLNDTAALIWLLATEGLDPDAITEQLACSAGLTQGETVDSQALRHEVWTSLAEWCRNGLLRQQVPRREFPRQQGEQPPSGHAFSSADETQPSASEVSLPSMKLLGKDQQWQLHTDSAPVLARLAPLLSPMAEDDYAKGLPRLEILRDSPGYTLVTHGEVLASRLKLASLAPALITYLARQAASTHQLVIDAGLLTTPEGTMALCLFATPEEGEALAKRLASSSALSLTRGIRLDTTTFMQAEPLGLPISATLLREATTSLLVLPEKGQVRQVIWINHEKAQEASPALSEPLSSLDALGALLPCCYAPHGKPLDADAITGLNDWLSQCERSVINLEDGSDATQILTQRLKAKPSAARAEAEDEAEAE